MLACGGPWFCAKYAFEGLLSNRLFQNMFSSSYEAFVKRQFFVLFFSFIDFDGQSRHFALQWRAEKTVLSASLRNEPCCIWKAEGTGQIICSTADANFIPHASFLHRIVASALRRYCTLVLLLGPAASWLRAEAPKIYV